MKPLEMQENSGSRTRTSRKVHSYLTAEVIHKIDFLYTFRA